VVGVLEVENVLVREDSLDVKEGSVASVDVTGSGTSVTLGALALDTSLTRRSWRYCGLRRSSW